MLARYRSLAVPLAVVAAVVLFYMVNPWFFPAVGSTERGIATVVFWVLMVAVLVLLFEDRNAPEAESVEVEGPAVERWASSVADKHGFVDIDHTLVIMGTCPACAAEGR